MAEAALRIDLPEHVAGVFFEVAQQQPDHLGLVLGVGLGAQSGHEVLEGRPHAGHHDAAIDQQQHAQRDGQRQVGHHQARGRRGAEDGNVGGRGAWHRGERKTTGADHAGHHHADQQLLLGQRALEQHQRQHSPQTPEGGGMQAGPPDRPCRGGGPHQPLLPANPGRHAVGRHTDHRQKPQAEHPRRPAVLEDDTDQRCVHHVGQHRQWRQAQHGLQLFGTECTDLWAFTRQPPIGPQGPAALHEGARARLPLRGRAHQRAAPVARARWCRRVRVWTSTPASYQSKRRFGEMLFERL